MKKKILIAGIALSIGLTGCFEKEVKEAKTPEIEDHTEETMLVENEDGKEWLSSYKGEDLDGNPVDHSVFAENELTLVNMWATWCPPCIMEIPELAELDREYEDSKVGIKGLLIETSETQVYVGVSEEEEETAREILEESKADYQQLLVSEDLVFTEGFMESLGVFPTTVFVDKDGRFVGEPVIGARDKDGWRKIIEERLEMVENE